MDPIEVNAGAWYLRALRSDGRVDDMPALQDGGIEDADYIGTRTRQWAEDERYSWAVCEPTTGELLAEVGLKLDGAGSAVLVGWARAGQAEALATGAGAVRRFAEGGLGLAVTTDLAVATDLG